MTRLLRDRRETRRMVLFLGAGLINTAFGYGVYALCVASGIDPAMAVVASTIAGVAFNFRTLGAVFATQGFARLPHFIAVYAALTPLNVGLLRLAQAMGANPYLGGALALAVIVPLTYLAMRLFVFPPETPADRRA